MYILYVNVFQFMRIICFEMSSSSCNETVNTMLIRLRAWAPFQKESYDKS